MINSHSDGYQVLTVALAEHARNVDALCGRLGQAVDAAREVSLPTDAYGVFCQLLPAVLNPLQHSGASALESSTQRLSTTAANIKGTARDYAETDDGTTLALHQAGGFE
ncbi:MAG: type VII secretion target [Pseudonocardiaceae bacterium]